METHINTVHNNVKNNQRAEQRKLVKNQMIKIVGLKVAGLGSELFSFDKMLTALKPSMIFFQETKMRTQRKIVTKNSMFSLNY